jgi:quercetin dioxygenase-like cupin family protein
MCSTGVAPLSFGDCPWCPGETTPWHRDPYHRVTVVVSGDVLSIEYHDGGQSDRVELTAGRVDWDGPNIRVHRAVNIGHQAYELVTVFFLDRADAAPQPIAT